MRGWGGVRASTLGLRLDETVVTGEREVHFRKVGFSAISPCKNTQHIDGKEMGGDGTRASLFCCSGQRKDAGYLVTKRGLRITGEALAQLMMRHQSPLLGDRPLTVPGLGVRRKTNQPFRSYTYVREK